jgi:CheY-like chemotaxis protein
MADDISNPSENSGASSIPSQDLQKTSKITLLIVNWLSPARERHIKMLESEKDIQVVGEVDGGLEAIAAYEELHPDVVCMSNTILNMDGLAATNVICHRHPEAKVIFLDLLRNMDEIIIATHCGVLEIANPYEKAEEIIQAIRKTANHSEGTRSRLAVIVNLEEGILRFKPLNLVIPEGLEAVGKMLGTVKDQFENILRITNSIMEGMVEIRNGCRIIEEDSGKTLEMLKRTLAMYEEIIQPKEAMLAPYRKIPMFELPDNIRITFELRSLIQYDLPFLLEKIKLYSIRREEWKFTIDEYCSLIKMHSLLGLSNLSFPMASYCEFKIA